MRIANENIISSGNVSLGASFELTAIYVGSVINYSIQLVWTGAPTGTFKLQCSNDPGIPGNSTIVSQRSNIINWTDITGSSQTIASDGNHTWDVQNCGYDWVRVIYTSTSGTGILISARVQIKGA